MWDPICRFLGKSLTVHVNCLKYKVKDKVMIFLLPSKAILYVAWHWYPLGLCLQGLENSYRLTVPKIFPAVSLKCELH